MPGRAEASKERAYELHQSSDQSIFGATFSRGTFASPNSASRPKYVLFIAVTFSSEQLGLLVAIIVPAGRRSLTLFTSAHSRLRVRW